MSASNIVNGVTVKVGTATDDDSVISVTGTASSGGGSAISVVDTTDSHGGTIRTITAVSLQGDTVEADKLLYGYTAHNALGEPITGTYVPSGSTPS